MFIITTVVPTSDLVCKRQSHEIPLKNCTDKIKTAIPFPFYKNCHSLRLIKFNYHVFVQIYPLTSVIDKRGVHTFTQFLFFDYPVCPPYSSGLGHIHSWKTKRKHFSNMTFLGKWTIHEM